MPFKAKYTFDYAEEPNPKERLRVGKECEKNLKLNVKKYKPIERQILYTNNILMISITYEGIHINEGIAAPTVQN
jgi:hypothetical protein